LLGEAGAHAPFDDGADLSVGIDGQSVEEETVSACKKRPCRLFGRAGTDLPEQACRQLDEDGALLQQRREQFDIVRGFERVDFSP